MITIPSEISPLSAQVNQVLNQETEQLQLIPEAAIKLLQLTNDENSDIRDLAKVIETDPSLTVEILKTVNSAAYNFPQPIKSVQHAISILGFSHIRNTALNLLFYSKLIKDRNSNRFDLAFFWQHCLFVASISREIAVQLNYPDPDLIYTAGLIHDIGKMALENHGKISYSDFIDHYARADKHSLLNSEEDFYGINHEQIGFILCQQWQLPEIITAIVAHHHSTDSEDKLYCEYKKEIAIVAMANYLAWIHGIGSFKLGRPPRLSTSVLENIAFNAIDLEILLNHVDQEMQETGRFYALTFPCLNQLRTNLVQSTITLNAYDPLHKTQPPHLPKDEQIGFLSSLTIPHQSLDPDIFVPQTLKAIQESFSFDRVFMLNMAARQRSLIAKYCWPQSLTQNSFEIKVETLGGDLLTCLRTQHATIISNRFNKNHKLLKHIGVNEFLAVPILRNNRLTAILYADNFQSKSTLSEQTLSKIVPIACELGSALHNAKQFELEKSKAIMDPLTGLSNKRMLTDFLERLFTENNTQLSKVAFGFMDIDHFKRLNDNCGHQVGDNALKIVGDTLRELSRSGDFVGRYGGEEFVFVLRDSSITGAYQYAERIRYKIEAKGQALKHRFNDQAITVSIGIAMYHPQYKNYQDLIAAADKAMYQAKNSGRNKVVAIHD